MADVGALIGAFIITFLLSRLALWLLRNRLAGKSRILTAHALVLAFSWVASAFGKADGGPLNWESGALYVLPVLCWAALDLYREVDTRGALR